MGPCWSGSIDLAIRLGLDFVSFGVQCCGAEFAVLPSMNARRSVLKFRPPYLFHWERSGVVGMELYFPLPGANAQSHHC